MVEPRIQPIGSGVAGGTVVREIELHVRWILAVVEVGCVARIAGGRRSFEHIVDVAGGAGQRAVGTGERVAGNAQVIEPGVEPRAHGVARLACSRKT